MQDGYVVVPQFFDGAAELRAAFEEHFLNPHTHTARHDVWDYWYVPETYTYLKTNPAKVVPEPLLARFLQRLNGWAIATLGVSTRLNPYLSLYVNGCRQAIHNDSTAGQLGYVYSITKWDERNFLGGETLLFRQNQYWGTDRIRSAGATVAFYEKVPARFNQLLLFDDRVIHGVEPIQGTMDPLCGRVVLHGHLRAESVIITGPLPVEPAVQVLKPVADRIQELCTRHKDLLHGFVTLRLVVEADGRVVAVRPLCDRLLPLSADASPIEPFKRDVAGMLAGVRFPPAPVASEVTVPVLVAG
jgi:hypothetical protein